MSDLHDLLVAELDRIRPARQPSFEELAGRARRRHGVLMLAAGAAVVAVVVGTIIGAVVVRAGNDRAAIIPAHPGAAARPLITRGECGGLSVTATLPGHPQRWPIRQGMQPNPIAMPPNALMWLRARGPCVNRLRISVAGGLIQTATGGVTTFNNHGIGLVVSNDKAGHATVDLFYSPAVGQGRSGNKIATIPVTITRDGTTLTVSPSPSP